MGLRTIDNIRIKEVEKRKTPTKHYVYIIEVQWSDGTISVVGRQYSAFFDFQMSLLEQFPVEGGQQDPASRIIPFLPGKILFRRSNTREVALRRMGPIAEYCMGISKLQKNISESEIVLDFFEPTSEDLTTPKSTDKISAEMSPVKKKTADKITGPLILDKYIAIAEYKKEDRKQLSLKEGEVVEVVEKNENGWWLAANEDGMNGWVPGVYLEALYGEKTSPVKKRANPGQGEMYTAIYAYTATNEEEVSFDSGSELEVLEKNLEGWWYVRFQGNDGWAPATYLEKAIPKVAPQTSASPLASGFKRTRMQSVKGAARPPPKRSTVRRTLTKAAIAKVQLDFKAKMIKQESFPDEEFASIYTTVEEFNSTNPDGISFKRDQTVHITQKSNAGWWYGRIGDQTGWVPETYLKTAEPEPTKSPRNTPTDDDRPPLPPSTSSKFQFAGKSYVKESTNKSPKPPRPDRPPAISKANNMSIPSKSPVQFGGGSAKITGGFNTFARSPPRNMGTGLPSMPRSTTPKIISSKSSKPLTEFHWYKDISRQDAEEALKSEDEEGYFIIRPSKRGAKQGKPFSLTLFHQGIVWNFHIRLRSNDQKYAVGMYKESEPCFTKMPELVEYYTDNFMVIGDDENKVKLVDSPSDIYDTC